MFKVGLFLLSLSLSHQAFAVWTVEEGEIIMDGTPTTMAASIPVSPKFSLPFPYTNTVAALAFRCDTKVSAYLYFSTGVQLDGESDDEGESVFARFKWDDKLEKRLLLSMRSNPKLVYIDTSNGFSEIAAQSSMLTVEIPLYGAGNAYFEIPLSGSSTAIKAVERACER
jgi:hypothetical protein